MPIQMNISDDDTKYLQQPAKAELETSIKKFTDRVLKEASLLEANSNTTGRAPEITSSMIKDAVFVLERGYRKKRNWWLTAFQGFAGVTTFFTGLLADLDKLKDPRLLVIFLIFLTSAIISTVVVVLKEQ